MQEISEEYFKRAREGDLQAFYRLYQSLSGFVFSVAMRMTQNTTDAEEITQDVFVKIHKNLKKYEARAALKTWVYKITINTALTFCKRKSAAKDKHARYESAEGVRSAAPEVVAKLAREDAARQLNEILACLNPDQRACIILRELEGLDYTQIADALNTNLNTVRSRLARARETLATYARQEGMQNELRRI